MKSLKKMLTELNSFEELNEYLIQNGKEGKPTCPIYFFNEDEIEKYRKKKEDV